jgi:general secretion pathway protein K
MALAVERLLVEPGSLVANGQVYPFEFDGVRLNVSIRSEHGKLDLNFASQEKISSLMRFMGATPQQSTLIASQLQNRRNEGRPLRYLEELLDATSISVDLYQRVLPFVTLWSGRGVPDAAFAAQPLRNALSLEAPRRRVGNPGSALSIESSAKLASGSKFVLLTTLVLGADVESGHLYRIVKWQEQ